MLQRILLDNTVFNYFGAVRSIDFFGLTLAHLPTPFFVSEAVFQEANRPKFYSKYPKLAIEILEMVQPEGNKLRLCTTYDEVFKQELKWDLDEGEAESIAQAQAIHSAIFVSDDEKAERKFKQLRISKKGPLISDGFNMVSSFFLLALLEAQNLLQVEDFESAKKEIYQIRNLANRNVRKKELLFSTFCHEMELAYNVLGILPSKPMIQEKCRPTND